MRKRLQKKHQTGPYKRFGFKVSGTFNAGTDADKLADAFIDFIESHRMQCVLGYGPGDDFDFYIDAGTRRMNPVRQRTTVLSWFEKEKGLSSFEAGPLVDAWNQPFRA